jgi:hypothetical protein
MVAKRLIMKNVNLINNKLKENSQYLARKGNRDIDESLPEHRY